MLFTNHPPNGFRSVLSKLANIVLSCQLLKHTPDKFIGTGLFAAFGL